jgi:hypothetical protein
MTEDTIDQDKLRDLLARTAELPREIEPPAEAWGVIRSALEEPVKHPIAFWQRPAFLIAASLTLGAASSLITGVVLSRGAAPSSMAIETSVRSESVSREAPASLAEFTARENQFISSANQLTSMIESGEVQLTPQTIAKLRESVRVIDAAILEARRALAEDPANTQLMEMLSTSYTQKVDLLERTAQMGRS